MNERDFDLLNDYFNGLLSEAEAQMVRDRTQTDEAFAEEFALMDAMMSFPARAEKRAGLKKTLESVAPDFFQEIKDETTPLKVRVNWGRRLAAAAAGLILIAGAYWIFNQPDAPEYRQYALHEPLSLTVRGVSDQAISDAEKAFGARDYAGALNALELLLTQDSTNITAQHYKGICLLELNRTTEARDTWLPIANGNSALKAEAQWYIALSYWKEKNMPAFKSALERIASGSDRYKEAQKLLKTVKW